jgi:hypothetical protein
MAREKQRQGDLQQGLLIVEEGLEILPTHNGLLSLKSILIHQFEQKHDQNNKKKKPRRPTIGTF